MNEEQAKRLVLLVSEKIGVKDVYTLEELTSAIVLAYNMGEKEIRKKVLKRDLDKLENNLNNIHLKAFNYGIK